MRLSDINHYQLRHLIDVIEYIDDVDPDSLPIKVERTVMSVHARVDVPTLRRQESLIAQGINVSKTLLFVFRNVSVFDSEVHKIRYKNRVYDVIGIEDVEERGLFLNILGEVKT